RDGRRPARAQLALQPGHVRRGRRGHRGGPAGRGGAAPPARRCAERLMGGHDPVTVWTTIIVVAAIVAAGRWVFLVLPRDWRPRGLLEQALAHAPLAALAGLVAPRVLASLFEPAPGATALAGLGDPRLLAAVAAIAAVHWRRNVFVGVV